MGLEGTCLCGGVKIKVDSDHDVQIACHCKDCQHTSGSAHSMNILVKDTDLHITGSKANYDAKAASGNTVTRVFCKNCGSAIAHKSVAFGDSTAVQTGNLLDHFKDVKVAVELFTKDRWAAVQPFAGAAQNAS